jgi:hypothetical protein
MTPDEQKNQQNHHIRLLHFPFGPEKLLLKLTLDMSDFSNENELKYELLSVTSSSVCLIFENSSSCRCRACRNKSTFFIFIR